MSYLRGDGIDILFFSIQLTLDQHTVSNAIILDFALGIDMINVIISVQTAQVNGLSAVHTPTQPVIIEVQLVSTEVPVWLTG